MVNHGDELDGEDTMKGFFVAGGGEETVEVTEESIIEEIDKASTLEVSFTS